MLTRRHLLRSASTTWVFVAAGCGARKAATPSDADTGVRDSGSYPEDSGVRDTAPVDTASADTGDTGATCAPTEDDIEGPFYRANAPERDDLAVPGDSGTPLVLSGRVLSVDGCVPVPGAVVDLWHADPDGAYDNDSPAWRYRGRVVADAEGGWRVRTSQPGRYLNGAQYRPAHVHVKIWVDGVERLTTQLYFPDDPYNGADPWYAPELEVVRTGAETARFDFVV